ncbi:hypothetical protein WNZ14_16730 [Hoeflea sp. AS60]|uniref:hypothetical protein n=1 Tax=Hoeflea sp. AS60 TaxID=3135780 RepID=UPI0031738484
MLIDMTAPMDSRDLYGWRSSRFRGRRQERTGRTGGECLFVHDEPDLRRKLGTSRPARATNRWTLRGIPQTNIAFSVRHRNKPLTAFVCHTLSNLRFDKAGAWLGWSNRDTNVPNESWFCSTCSGKAQCSRLKVTYFAA